jgi:hypothetical protein
MQHPIAGGRMVRLRACRQRSRLGSVGFLPPGSGSSRIAASMTSSGSNPSSVAAWMPCRARSWGSTVA